MGFGSLMWMNIGTLLTAVLFGIIGFYLSLIAKFYRLKFKKGPSALWMQAFLGSMLLGMLLKLGPFAIIPGWLPALLACIGGLGFSAFAYALYRTMLSV